MALNFKILLKQNSKSLYLKLIGDFDGSSALELINTLKEHGKKAEKIFINTRDIFSIHPFGQDVFRKNCTILYKNSHKLIFTGEKSSKLSPEADIY